MGGLQTKGVPFSGWRYIKGKRLQKLKYRRERGSYHLGISKGLSKYLEQTNRKNMQRVYSRYVKEEASQLSCRVPLIKRDQAQIDCSVDS